VRIVLAIRELTLKAHEGAPHSLFLTDQDHLNQDLIAFIRA
jgi:hypothetical protein